MNDAMLGHWLLDREITFLNHGSFGACPIPVLNRQRELVEDLEREPVTFMVGELESRIDEAREALGRFIGADGEGLAFVPNATAGVNAVLRSLRFEPGDELLTTDQEYNACRNVLELVAAMSGAKVVVAEVPFPLRTPEEIIDAILGEVTPRTRLALLDHVSSQTALVFPVEELVSRLGERGVEVLIDGAHAPGMLPLDVRSIGAAFYTANAHKWLCAPKGAAFLWVREDWRETIRPTAISHGANSTRTDRSRYHLEFDWTGTFDPTPWLVVPEAIRFIGSLHPGGWEGVMRQNHGLAIEGRRILCDALSIEEPAPGQMLGSMASLPLPDGMQADLKTALYGDPLQDALMDRHRIEVPVVPWPGPPKRLLRISAQLYNDRTDYEALAEALTEELAREGS
jgi:isopenicillin-N epimerase